LITSATNACATKHALTGCCRKLSLFCTRFKTREGVQRLRHSNICCGRIVPCLHARLPSGMCCCSLGIAPQSEQVMSVRSDKMDPERFSWNRRTEKAESRQAPKPEYAPSGPSLVLMHTHASTMHMMQLNDAFGYIHSATKKALTTHLLYCYHCPCR